MIRLLAGDCRDVLPTLPAESVQCVVTSPPYYGLRDYGTALWDGGDAACDHKPRPREVLPPATIRNATFRNNATSYLHQDNPGRVCRCGAVRVDRQIGLEASPDAYLATMVGVFREVRRVLRRDGTCWVNMGDSYASSGIPNPDVSTSANLGRHGNNSYNPKMVGQAKGRAPTPAGLKPKDLLLMPARLALALQAPQHYGPITKETDRAWLAALIDGEGTISIARNVAAKSRGGEEYCQVGYTPFISIGNQDRELLDKCVAITGYGKVNVKDRPSVDPRGINMRRTYYGWRIDARQAIAVLRDVFPYLVAKRKQAVLAHTLDVSNLAGRSLRGNGPLPSDEQAKREQLKVLCNAANQRQPVDMPTWAVEPPSNFEQGWWVRSDIIWHKPNPMPESCTDRPTSAHEHVFLLTKAARYFYDADAVRETLQDSTIERGYTAAHLVNGGGPKEHGNSDKMVRQGKGWWNNAYVPPARNLRNVWTLATHAYSDAHFATFPPELAERCIKAGTSERGCCAACGKPWARVTERGDLVPTRKNYDLRAYGVVRDNPDPNDQGSARAAGGHRANMAYETTTTGWSAGCQCEADVAPCVVLDPFAGAGTTLLVADRLQRDAIGIELNTAYTELAMERCRQDAPLFTSFPPAEPPEDERMGDLFAGDEYEQRPTPVQRDAFRNSGRYVNQGPQPSNGVSDMAAD